MPAGRRGPKALFVPRSYGDAAARVRSRSFASERPELMRDSASTFTTAELERLLDWFQGLRLCHGDVPRDYELADKIAFELAKLRRPVEQP
jgi:hypothetical protein